MLTELTVSIQKLISEFDEISVDRKKTLGALTQFIQNRIDSDQQVNLNFICTHNSRRSHMAQLWAQAASTYYGINNVQCFSGGTEATAFNPRAVRAMQEAGFDIRLINESENPVYEVLIASDLPPITSFSKTYDDQFNRCENFAAIMTCSDADENCPMITGASARIAITYDDPKHFDGLSQETFVYRERAQQIGREMLYVFSQVKKG